MYKTDVSLVDFSDAFTISVSDLQPGELHTNTYLSVP